jgi:FkbM family methyltransferase
MKHVIQHGTPKFIRSFFVRLGRFFDWDSLQFPSQEAAFRTLLSLGWQPQTCIDVGGYHGDWAKMFRSVFPMAKVLMIEAQESKRKILEKTVATSPRHLDFEIALLGETDGRDVDFFEMETGSSVFEETSPYPRKKTRRKLVSLDSLLDRHAGFKQAQALKIDVQGYELNVLKGASALLDVVEVVLMEASLIPVNKGAPVLADIVEFMKARQFRLFDFCSQIRRKDGVLWQTDLLFVREGSLSNLHAKLTRENWR